MTRRVIVFDTTLRDGEQAPGNSLSIEEKVRLARQLEVLGVDVIEAGFPASSETDFRSVQEIAAQVRRPVIAALARCTERDIDLAGEIVLGPPIAHFGGKHGLDVSPELKIAQLRRHLPAAARQRARDHRPDALADPAALEFESVFLSVGGGRELSLNGD